jgi:HprK-related kinase A
MLQHVVRIPPFTIGLRTPFSEVRRHLEFHYGAAPYRDTGGFIDFDISIVPPSGPRRWWRPQARFLLDDVEPFFPLPLDQAAPMFEWGLNWCIASRPLGYLVIHAAVAEIDGHALLMPGFPGAGKSTLCASLTHLGGWRLLSDELAIIDAEDGLLRPHPRPICIKNESIGIVSGFPGARVGTIYTDTRKGTIGHAACPPESAGRAGEFVPARWIVFPRFEAGGGLATSAVSRAEAFACISEQSFNRERMGEVGFRALCRLLSACDCHELVYGSTEEAIAGIARICGK